MELLKSTCAAVSSSHANPDLTQREVNRMSGILGAGKVKLAQ